MCILCMYVHISVCTHTSEKFLFLMIIVIKTLKLLHWFELPLKIHNCSHKMSFQLQKPNNEPKISSPALLACEVPTDCDKN